MKTEKSINYTLSINEPEGHGIYYPASLENDTACLMMTLQILEHSREGLKMAKKVATDKKAIGKQISDLSKTIMHLNELTMQLCDNFEYLKASADLKEAKLAITE